MVAAICDARVWTTREEYLVVFIAIQNLVGIGVVVLKKCDFQYYAIVWLKNAYSRSFWGDFGSKNRGNGNVCSVIPLGMQ